MPVSDFLWSVQATQLQGGGMKRKFSGDACPLESQEQMTKRRCTVMSAGGDCDMYEVDDENHNEMASQNLNNIQMQTTPINDVSGYKSSIASHAASNMVQGQQQLTCSGLQSQLLHVLHNPSIGHQQQNSPHYPQQQAQQSLCDQENNMIMNINDEVYSNSIMPLNEEMAGSCMDSDCVPNQQQYNVRIFDTHDMAVGESTSAIERVKCYCRPTWEGLLEMKPYISDYY